MGGTSAAARIPEVGASASASIPVGGPSAVASIPGVGSRAADSGSIALEAEVERLRSEVAMLRHTLAACKAGDTPSGSGGGELLSGALPHRDVGTAADAWGQAFGAGGDTKGGLPPCAVDWGAWSDGQLIHTAHGLTLPSCCELCRSFPGCDFYNSAGGSGEPRCLLLRERKGRLGFTDPARMAISATGARTESASCSCAAVGSYLPP